MSARRHTEAGRQPRCWLRGGWRRALASVVIAVGAGCGPGRSKAVLQIFAASSLTEAFAALERDFEATHAEVDVRVSTAGSQALRTQLEHGAVADLFASADARHVEALREGGLLVASERFATNELVLVVPRDNPAGLGSLEDLPRAARVVLGSEAVPAGAYARAMLERAAGRYGAEFRERVQSHVVSTEPNVRLVLAKVELGEADAAVVYRTDVTAAREVEVIPIPAALNVQAEYHLAILGSAPEAALARAFASQVRAPAGQRVLARHGFGARPGG